MQHKTRHLRKTERVTLSEDITIFETSINLLRNHRRKMLLITPTCLEVIRRLIFLISLIVVSASNGALLLQTNRQFISELAKKQVVTKNCKPAYISCTSSNC